MESKFNKKRILLIDDDRYIIETLTDGLELKGYEVERALSGSEGLRKARSFRPAVIILDLEMPDLSGFEVLEKLKKDPKTKHISVFILTVRDEREKQTKGFLLGAREYVVKPFSLNMLEELIESALLDAKSYFYPA